MAYSFRAVTSRLVAFMIATSFTVAIVAGLLDKSSDRAVTALDLSDAAIEQRLKHDVSYLASDKLEGRGLGTKGLDLAANHIAAEFVKIGLKTAVVDGKPFQSFQLSTSTEMGPKENNRLAFTGPTDNAGKSQEIPFILGQQFNPLAVGGSGAFDLPLVFVGYGITAKDKKYDDYEGMDVEGKAVIILRKTPGQIKKDGPFNSAHGTSRHAAFNTKISNAYQHGVAMVVLVNDGPEIARSVQQQHRRLQATVKRLKEITDKFSQIPQPTKKQIEQNRLQIKKLGEFLDAISGEYHQKTDPILDFNRAGSGTSGRNMPVVFASRTTVSQVIKTAFNVDLNHLEREIDKDLKPKSAVLDGWKTHGETSVLRKQSDVKNVIGVLEGAGPLADETIVIGAHYDHLGYGGAGSRAPGSKEIHNGADDNGSGTSALLEVARQLAAHKGKLRRRIVFIAFTAEERGLIGSAHYVANPKFPLDKTIAMLNMDMVGRLKDNGLIIQGISTSKEFDAIIEDLNKKYKFKITKKAGGRGPSDHASFYGKKIPVMHFFTGLHSDYHKPSDDTDKLNLPGMRRITHMVVESAMRISQADKRPQFVQSGSAKPAVRSGTRPYFGSIPDFKQNIEGYAISGVTKDSPAEKAGLKTGDILVKLGDNKIGNLEDFDTALRKFKAGDKVMVEVLRGGKPVKLEVTLASPK